MRKTMVALIAGALVVGGAAVASAQSDEAEDKSILRRPMAVLEDVLEELVAEGTIEQSDADAVLAAVEEEKESIRAEVEERREEWRALWEDGVLTVDEIEQVAPDHPLLQEDGPAAEYLEDGRLTREELHRIGHRLRRAWLHLTRGLEPSTGTEG